MPATFEIHSDRKLIILTLTGSVSNADLLSARQAVEAHPEFNAAYRMVVDASAADVSGLQGAALAERARRPPPVVARTALVTPSDLGFGLARMYSTLTQIHQHPGRVGAFRTLAEAVAWVEEDEGPNDP